MSVGDNTYAEHEDVERLIGDVVLNRTFSISTVPTLDQVEAELDSVAAELNALLDMKGYTVKVSETSYPHAYNALKAANAYGASARLLGTIPTEAYDPSSDMVDMGTTRAQMYERYLNQMKKQIKGYELRAGMRKNRLSRVFTGGQEDSAGNVRDPLFKRGMLNKPGAEVSTEDEIIS